MKRAPSSISDELPTMDRRFTNERDALPRIQKALPAGSGAPQKKRHAGEERKEGFTRETEAFTKLEEGFHTHGGAFWKQRSTLQQKGAEVPKPKDD
jgi:hypothetical protein